MSNNQVIELRQLGTDTIQYTDSNGNIKNGDFKTRLKKPITLNQGDTLRLNQIFLQTEELSDDQIKIDNPITLKLHFYRYVRDCINQLFPRYDQLTNTSASGESIELKFTPSTIIQQNGFSIFGGAAQTPEILGAPNANAGKMTMFNRTGEIMVECLTKNSDGVNTANAFEILDITFKKIDATKATTKQIVLIEYKNILDQTSVITEQIPALNDTNTHTINLKLVGKDLGGGSYFNIINIVNIQQNNLTFDNQTIGQQIQNVACLATPVSASRQVTIPAGIYHATELALVITDAFNDTGLENQPFNTTEQMLQQNSFLDIADNTAGIGNTANAGVKVPNENPFGTSPNMKMFVNQSGQFFNVYGTCKEEMPLTSLTQEAIPNRPNILCGTDSFSLEYDDSLSKYKISKIHYSINDMNGNTSNQILDNPFTQTMFIDSNGDSFGSLMFDRNGEPDVASFLGLCWGGIIITAFSAFDEFGDFINFWEDTLGFDTNSITSHLSQPFSAPNVSVHKATSNALTEVTALGNSYTTISETISTFTYSALDGINVTTDQATISGLHYADSKTVGTNGRVTGSGASTTSGVLGHRYFNALNPTNDDTANTIIYNQFINTTLTKQIFARDIFESKNLNFAYYLVEINALINNDFITSAEIKNKIFSVINRYYQLGGYLSGTNSGIQYTHDGQSVMISDIQVRILQADGTIANNLKNDNTVFLELLRG